MGAAASDGRAPPRRSLRRTRGGPRRAPPRPRRYSARQSDRARCPARQRSAESRRRAKTRRRGTRSTHTQTAPRASRRATTVSRLDARSGACCPGASHRQRRERGRFACRRRTRAARRLPRPPLPARGSAGTRARVGWSRRAPPRRRDGCAERANGPPRRHTPPSRRRTPRPAPRPSGSRRAARPPAAAAASTPPRCARAGDPGSRRCAQSRAPLARGLPRAGAGCRSPRRCRRERRTRPQPHRGCSARGSRCRRRHARLRPSPRSTSGGARSRRAARRSRRPPRGARAGGREPQTWGGGCPGGGGAASRPLQVGLEVSRSSRVAAARSRVPNHDT
mmetsp:Transcript_35556/g.117000  ORF Transcript_35556/g.117000 Transcript_35556/m.117000 type:complete len:336 (-) Transcript_35556:15-1022(-)